MSVRCHPSEQVSHILSLRNPNVRRARANERKKKEQRHFSPSIFARNLHVPNESEKTVDYLVYKAKGLNRPSQQLAPTLSTSLNSFLLTSISTENEVCSGNIQLSDTSTPHAKTTTDFTPFDRLLYWA